MTVFYPPYYNSFGDTWYTVEGEASFSRRLGHYEDRNTGLISTDNGNKILDPGNFARQVTGAYSGMQFYIQMPSSGRLKVVTNLVAYGYGLRHQGWMSTEAWGVSSATVTQGANYMMWISDPENEFINNFIYYTRGDWEGYWENILAYEGELRQYTFVSQALFNAGDWVLLNAQIDNYQYGRMNDMDFWANTISGWYITQIDVTSVP
jgi:hypothetical protein